MPDYSNHLYDPFASDTVEKLGKYSEFQFTAPDKAKTIAYIIVMYDINSDMKKIYPDNYWERKRNSAIKAGFKINEDGKFEKHVEDFLVGENDQVNEAILFYIRMFGIPDLPVLMAYTEILHKQVLAALKVTDAGKLVTIQKNIETAIAKISVYERRIFSGDETESARKSLYLLMEKQRLNLRPEAKAKEIESKELKISDPYTKKRRGRPKKDA